MKKFLFAFVTVIALSGAALVVFTNLAAASPTLPLPPPSDDF
jgi:hypothetical protein